MARALANTGARHAGKTRFCTQIGNDWFTWFATRSSKSRLNFLDLLRAGHTDYVLNDAAYGYMRQHALSAPLIARLAAQPQAVPSAPRPAATCPPLALSRTLFADKPATEAGCGAGKHLQ
jgi:hypothetical protein